MSEARARTAFIRSKKMIISDVANLKKESDTGTFDVCVLWKVSRKGRMTQANESAKQRNEAPAQSGSSSSEHRDGCS